jgi:hypothetical protein
MPSFWIGLAEQDDRVDAAATISAMSGLAISAFPNTPVSLGLLCDFVSRFPPFGGFEFRQMAVALRYQLETQSHLVAGFDDRIVAYIGWIRTTKAIAESWINGNGALTAVAENADAVAATILVTENSRYVLPLVRSAKTLNRDYSVYWKRQFSDGREDIKRSVRKKD